jgi:hypothetical protein
MGSNHFYFAKNSCEKIVPTHNSAARVLDIDMLMTMMYTIAIAIKHYVKVNVVYYLD